MRFYWKQWMAKDEFVRFLLAVIPGLLVGTVLLPIIPASGFRILGIYKITVFYFTSQENSTKTSV